MFCVHHNEYDEVAIDVLHPGSCEMSWNSTDGVEYECGIAFEIRNGGFDAFFEEERDNNLTKIRDGYHRARMWMHDPTYSDTSVRWPHPDDGPQYEVIYMKDGEPYE